MLRAAGIAGAGLAAPGLLAGCWGEDAEQPPESYAATIAEARAAITKALADTGTSAISAALIDGERVVWAEAFGTIDKAARVAPGATTMFAIGSVSKVLAAIATMILVDRRLVDLDAPLTRYLPDFRMASPEYTQVTVRMLLSHASGFPGTEARNIFTTAAVSGYATQVMQTLATLRLKHAPGELAVYCNDGFTMIEPLVTAITGKSYVQFVQDEILAPLAMTHSRFALEAFAAGSYAPAYAGDTKLPQEFVNAYASGGLYSTPSDMGRLAMMLMNGGELSGRRVLSELAVAEMGRDQTAGLPFNPVPAYKFGLGWDGIAQPGLAAVGIQAWHKNGGTTYYGSEFFVAPVQRLAVMITGTTSTYGGQRLAELILLRALVERGILKAMPSVLSGSPLPQRSPTDAELSAMAGCYGRYDALLRLESKSDRTLTLSEYADGAWKTTATGLRLRTDGTFSTDAEPGTAYRALTADDWTCLVRRKQPGYGHYKMELPHAQRLEPGAALSSAWRARAGGMWLVVNDNPRATQFAVGMGLDAVTELPGYVVTAGGQVVDASASDTVARMCLKIPQEGGRDLYDVVIEKRQGEEWLRCGSFLFRPAAGVPALAVGTHRITIDSEGLAQWRRLPTRGTVAVAGGTGWRLYDENFAEKASGEGSGSAPLPGDGQTAWLALFGNALATITVTVA